MSSHLMSPGPGPQGDYSHPRWRVCKGLNERIEGEREVLEVKRKTVILPDDVRLLPKREALDRGMELFAEDC